MTDMLASLTDTTIGRAPRISRGGCSSTALVGVLARSLLITVGCVDLGRLPGLTDDTLALFGCEVSVGSRLVGSLS